MPEIKFMISKMLKIAFFLSLFSGLALGTEKKGFKTYVDERSYARAKIIDIEIKKVDEKNEILLLETNIHLKVLDGPHQGEIKKAIFGGENDLPQEMNYKTGDTVFIGISGTAEIDSAEYISIYDIDNSNNIIFLVILMVLAIVLIGRFKGVASLFALVITMVLIFFVLIPLTLKGYSALPITVAISIFSIFITLPIITGFHLKTLAAILGASIGIILACFLAIGTGFIIHLSGIITNDMLTVFYASDIKIDLRGLALSGMIIAALGAIMDICISISSATAEIFKANPQIPEKEAFKSVLNIGTDILGTMVNTLILAYVGSSLSIILLIAMKLQPGMPFWMVLNYNPVLNEIVKSVIGSVGLFISIPLTAFISVKLYKRKNSTLVS